MNYLCFDIGGTNIKYAVVSNNFHYLQEVQEVPTEKTKKDNNILNQIISITNFEKQKYLLEGVCISSSGVIDPKHGSIKSAGQTIPGYTGTKVATEVWEQCSLPCTIENDVNCALLAEMSYLNDKYRNVFCLTVGTGIGGACVIDRKLYTGNTGYAGEIGYLPINNNLNYQDIACTKSLIDSINSELNLNLTNGREVLANLESNHKIEPIIDDWLKNIASGILMIQYILAPDLIIIGGGIFMNNQLFINKLQNIVDNSLEKSFKTHISLSLAKFGNNAGLIGALIYFLHKKGIK